MIKIINKKLFLTILITYSSNLFAHDHAAFSAEYTDVLALALMALGVLFATIAVVIERIYHFYPPENGRSDNKSAAIKTSMNSKIHTPISAAISIIVSVGFFITLVPLL